MNKETLRKNLREIPDFPKPGILFYDVTTLFKNSECLSGLIDELYEMYKDKGITKVVGIESRGFILGGALAARLGASFIMARKPGKLPAEVIEETYEKEYGTDTIQLHKDAISEDDVVLLHDDLLATGGTMAATHRLVKKAGAKETYINFVIELKDLNGRKAFPSFSAIMDSKEELKTSDYLRGIVLNLPDSPGIYQYLNTEGTIIYVGKAKNLKRRVYSYFAKEHQSAKTRILVSKIADIKYIVVNSEEDALLLENNLIKKYKPRYNVLLKDDKSYPSICISNEYFPRVFKTRKIIRKEGTYFGPYSHVPSMMAVLELIKKLYNLRTCHLALTPENISQGKFKVCLEYHIKNCKGPCIGLQSHEEYMKQIAEIKEILKGNTRIIRIKERSSKLSASQHRCILYRD